MMTSIPTPTDTLFLGDLSVMSTENDVATAMNELGIRDFTVKICFKNGKQCKYGFVNFSSVEKSQKAFASLKDGFLIHGRRIRVRYGGIRIVDATPFNALSSQVNVSIHSVHVRFCTMLEYFDEFKMAMFFHSHGNIVDVCITESELVSRKFSELLFRYPLRLTCVILCSHV